MYVTGTKESEGVAVYQCSRRRCRMKCISENCWMGGECDRSMKCQCHWSCDKREITRDDKAPQYRTLKDMLDALAIYENSGKTV